MTLSKITTSFSSQWQSMMCKEDSGAPLTAQVQFLDKSLIPCVTCGKLLKDSVPQFHHLQSGTS